MWGPSNRFRCSVAEILVAVLTSFEVESRLLLMFSGLLDTEDGLVRGFDRDAFERRDAPPVAMSS